LPVSMMDWVIKKWYEITMMPDGGLNQYGIYRLPIQTPFPVGKVNSYFVEGPVPTLIDVPPHGNSYLKELRDGIAHLGYSLQDVKRIIVTHPHIDHFGSAAAIAAESGAEVWVSKEGARWLEHYEDELLEDELFSRDFLGAAGVSAERVENILPRFFRPARELARRIKPSRYLAEGDEVMLGRILFRVMAVPGHTPWCMLIYHERDRIAFSGDFLLKEISSNALCQRPYVVPEGYRSLKAYTASLERVRDMHFRLVLPGHGDVIESPSARIEELLSFIGERRRLMRDILARGVQTPFQIMNELFPDLPGDELFLAISEIVGHLEILEEKGLAVRLEGTPIRFTWVD
jgi:glyoxylase-like metal-dependent hydrolase (beta-lactamase superfamily II)